MAKSSLIQMILILLLCSLSICTDPADAEYQLIFIMHICKQIQS